LIIFWRLGSQKIACDYKGGRKDSYKNFSSINSKTKHTTPLPITKAYEKDSFMHFE